MLEERRAYHIKNFHLQSYEKFFSKFNTKTQEELLVKKRVYDYRNASQNFENIVTIGNAIASIENGEYIWNKIM